MSPTVFYIIDVANTASMWFMGFMFAVVLSIGARGALAKLFDGYLFLKQRLSKAK